MYVINCVSKEIIKVTKMSEIQTLIDTEECKIEDLIIVEGKDASIYVLKQTLSLDTAQILG